MRTKNFIRVARTKDAIFVGVVGQGNMNNSSTFRAFADRMVSSGYKNFVVDLSDCRGMDSTFLGILFSITQGPRGDSSPEVIVVNPGNHNMKLLQGVGLDAVLKVKLDPTEVPGLAFEILEESTDPHRRLETIRLAHQNLLLLDSKNEKQFGPFLRALTKEFK
ncbi:MAG: STAS domain-containing protein [Planctomycetota bacterium]|nr:STAS domain-containing protein [Planctomycetota bacterium]